MNLYRLKLETQKQLRNTRDHMLELTYLLALEASSEETKRKSAVVLSTIQLSDLRLRRMRMNEIRTALEQNEDDLRTSTESLQNTLQTLEQVGDIINAATSVLNVVARVLA